ncbi:DsbA family protein [Roseicyclus sp. F158]|uniref:DsbA family protein n=1 Tax=Tropicimonas omnivorans TaxID=3075590 RepID=A0ABU3DJ87_9RHOB|nr:DsbA family protein [Roseicyclus sp. F158]MDT0683762.1 DsbA family protein [Roseicyclus sp. F158]
MRRSTTAPIQAACAAALLAFPLAGTANAHEDLTEDRVRELVLETIRQNPQIVMEAVAILEAQQSAEQAEQSRNALSVQREALESAENAPVIGNPDGDVTVVEFFDYNCPYCRRATAEVNALLEEDDDVRVVLREWPILSEGSVFAARAALAAREQGLYEAFHNALMTMAGRADEPTVMRVAEEVGLDTEQLRADMESPEVDAHIQQSLDLAQSIGFSGTPSFVIGEEMAPGFVERAALAEMVEAARDADSQ